MRSGEWWVWVSSMWERWGAQPQQTTRAGARRSASESNSIATRIVTGGFLARNCSVWVWLLVSHRCVPLSPLHTRRSHTNAAAAHKSGALWDEITPGPGGALRAVSRRSALCRMRYRSWVACVLRGCSCLRHGTAAGVRRSHGHTHRTASAPRPPCAPRQRGRQWRQGRRAAVQVRVAEARVYQGACAARCAR